MQHKLKWVIHPNRYKKAGMAVRARQPVVPSEYYKYLRENGAGWKVDDKTKKINV